jgi:hypothetical protein
MGQGAEDLRVTARALARGVLSRWGIHVRFGHRNEADRGREIEHRSADAPVHDVYDDPAPARSGARARPEFIDRPPVGTPSRPRTDEIRGIFSHTDPRPAPARAVATPDPRLFPRGEQRIEAAPERFAEAAPQRVSEPALELRTEARPEHAASLEHRPRQVTIVDTQVRRRKMRGSIGLVLGWRNDALRAGVKAADASLTVMRLSVNVHLRTRAARIDYAKTFSFALGQEVGAARTTPIARAERSQPRRVEESRRDGPRLDRYQHAPRSSDDEYADRERTAYRAPSLPAQNTAYRAPTEPLQHAQGDLRSAGMPFIPSVDRRRTHRSADGGYGPGN